METNHEDEGKGTKFDISKLSSVVPEIYFSEFELFNERYNVNTKNRVSHFISQAQHESANFTTVTENLNYSSMGLLNTFPKYFPDEDTAKHYAKQPEKIANRVYANRMGNGDEISGDGWKFRGRGIFQLTGKGNYTAFSMYTKKDILNNPGFLQTPNGAVESALWFWTRNGLNKLADKGADDAVVKEITKVINGGFSHLAERQKLFKEVYQLLL